MAHRDLGERWACTACGKPLIGARTRAGMVAPIEIDPHERGNVLLQRRRDGDIVAITMGGQLLELAREAGVELRCNHFATCEHAEQFRKESAHGATD